MPFLRNSIVACLLAFCCFTLCGQSKDVNFPTDDEIRLVVTQSTRAVEQYKPLLDMEEKMLGKEGQEAVNKDREVVRSIELALKGFGENPKAFNSALGFTFNEWLDDASRNAALCSANAMSDAMTSLLDGNKSRVDTDLLLSQACSNVSMVFFTVAENAGALYTRYAQAIEKLAADGAKVSEECAKVLKQEGVSPKQ
jgi:hypothetical protein